MRWLFLLLFVAISSASHGADQKPNQTTQTPAKGAQGTKDSPVFIEVVPSSKIQAETKAEQSQADEKSHIDRKLVKYTKWLVGVTSALAFFTGGLWLATYLLARDAKRGGELQSRAYISAFPNYIFTFNSEIIVRMKVEFENHGNTPGYRFSTVSKVEILPYPLPDNLPITPEVTSTKKTQALHPRQKTYSTVTAERLFTADEIRAAVAVDGGSRIYCYGIVFYETHGIQRSTKFCRSVIPGDSLEIISHGESRSVQLDYELTAQHNEAT